MHQEDGRAQQLAISEAPIPAFIFRAGGDPLHYGALAAARSLGRLGIPIYAAVEHLFTPLAASRYCQHPIVLPNAQMRDPERLLEWLSVLAPRFAQPPVVIATDDESAIVLAEHRAELSKWYCLCDVPAALPSQLARKSLLSKICLEHEIPTPISGTPRDLNELNELSERMSFPLVVKNDAPFERLKRPAVKSTTIVKDRDELAELARNWQPPFAAVIQEYLPQNSCSDWFTHAYTDVTGVVNPIYTGVKVRSWPPHGGVTSYGVAIHNDQLAEQTSHLLEKLSYRGIADLDWRFDHRDGEYKLLDFNPRVGAQFALFRNSAGLDVVRAMYLDLTGYPIASGTNQEGDRYVVEHIDLPSRFMYRREGYVTQQFSPGKLRFAWLSIDDPMPVAVAIIHVLRRLAKQLFPHRFLLRI